MGQWADYMEAIGVDPYGDYDLYRDRHGNFGYEEDSECYDSDQVESEEEEEPLPTFKSRKKFSRSITHRIAPYPGVITDAWFELPVGVAADPLSQCGGHKFVQIAV